MLDKRMLDPRRPKGPPTPEDQLEQLIPYQQILVMSPLLYATHSKQVAQISVFKRIDDKSNTQRKWL
ncbi:hypothetical protein MMC08_005301 [Hypocenomyce scalaris]|nr:hypothetical protein [Hypocenomyce scalaris]